MTDTSSLATAIARRYSPEYLPQRIEPVDAQQSFSDAEIYLARTAAGSFALRGWPPQGFPRARIDGLHTLLHFLAANGIAPVAAPVRTLSGETLWTLVGRDWHLEPWKSGAADFLANPHPQRLKNAMNCLAAWHQAAALWKPQRESAEWFASASAGASSAIDERLQRFRYWSGRRLSELRQAISHSPTSPWTEIAMRVIDRFERLANRSHADLVRMSHLRFPLQPCLRDVWADHVLFVGNEVTGLIDPTACRADNVAVDLARLLGSFLGDDKDRWNEALETYHDCRPLGGAERDLVAVLDHSNVLLSAMTWLDRFFLKQTTIPHPEAALQRLTDYARRIEHLASSTQLIVPP